MSDNNQPQKPSQPSSPPPSQPFPPIRPPADNLKKGGRPIKPQ